MQCLSRTEVVDMIQEAEPVCVVQQAHQAEINSISSSISGLIG